MDPAEFRARATEILTELAETDEAQALAGAWRYWRRNAGEHGVTSDAGGSSSIIDTSRSP